MLFKILFFGWGSKFCLGKLRGGAGRDGWELFTSTVKLRGFVATVACGRFIYIYFSFFVSFLFFFEGGRIMLFGNSLC
jgi:hypothetical protein